MATVSKRARVMDRSRKLGHCICDPRKPCPCDVLREKDVCLCAGERLEPQAPVADGIALTRLVKNTGCASKIPPADLERVLSRLPAVSDPRVLVGAGAGDDAGVFQVSPDLCLVQTVDVFAPCVDDPHLFGRIAACNSLSDIYAMGATPLTALSVVGYPVHTLSDEWLYRMLRGGMDALAEAQVALIGGHSINDEEIKFGFAVTGVVEPAAIVTNAGARPGDALILTKALGTGIICFAAQVGRASEQARAVAAATMATSNRVAAEVMRQVGAHACTDITGFGLLGHLAAVVRGSGVTVELWWEAAPVLPGAREYAAQGIVGGAAERNREFAQHLVEAPGAPEWALDLFYDAQTSGGLLMAVAPDRAQQAVAQLRGAGCAEAAIIGTVRERSKGRIVVRECHSDANVFSAGGDSQPGDAGAARLPGAPAPAECCAPGTAAAAGAAHGAFQQFMAAVFAPGALDVVQKELTTIALSVAVQCGPCLELHLGKARAMGISAEEIEEAAWMGVAFGGCKAMMFWQERSRAQGT